MTAIYSVCGLSVRSNRAIPDLVPAEPASTVDVEINFLGSSESCGLGQAILRYCCSEVALNGDPVVRLWEAASPVPFYTLQYADGSRFVIDASGSNIWAMWAKASIFEDTLMYLLGPVLGFVLRLRGVTCLHASAVAIVDSAIALVGPAGAGKSTMAAQFCSMGYPVLSDDIVTLDPAGDFFLVQPAPARLRLWPSSVEHLCGQEDALPRLTPSWEKRYLDLRAIPSRYHSAPLPLAAVYLLNEAEEPAQSIANLPRPAAMMQLLGNVYVNYLLDDIFRERDFMRLAKMLNTVPVRKVNLPRDFAALERTCRAIREDFDLLKSSVPGGVDGRDEFVSSLD